MLQLATAHEPTWRVVDLELSRPGPSYTNDTVRSLLGEALLPAGTRLWLILGSDNLVGLERWREAQALLELARPIIIWRAGDNGSLPDALRSALPAAQVEALEAGYLRLPPTPGRSTELRQSLAAGQVEQGDLPGPVLDYIRERGLYRGVP